MTTYFFRFIPFLLRIVENITYFCPGPLDTSIDGDCNENLGNEDTLDPEAELRGLSYESCLQKEDMDVTGEEMFSLAPGEGHIPIPILTDKHFEEMCNPTKYPRVTPSFHCMLCTVTV